MEHSWKENCFFISFWFNKTTDTLCLPLRLHRYVWNIHFSKLCVLLFHISYSRWENCMSKRTGQSGSPALSKQRLLECEIWKGPWHLSSRSTSNLTFPFAFEISSPWKTVRGKTQVLTRTVAVVNGVFQPCSFYSGFQREQGFLGFRHVVPQDCKGRVVTCGSVCCTLHSFSTLFGKTDKLSGGTPRPGAGLQESEGCPPQLWPWTSWNLVSPAAPPPCPTLRIRKPSHKTKAQLERDRMF